jgi:hypothetical protein
MHPRQLIRQRIVERLLGATDAGVEVEDSEMWNVWPEKTPAIRVFSSRDDVELYRQAPRTFKGTLSVEIELFCTDRKNLATNERIPAHEVLDTLIDQVLSLLESDPLLRDPVTKEAAAAATPENGVVQSIDTDFASGGPLAKGGARITLRYVYLREAAIAPIPPSNPLQVVNVEYELEGNNETPEAVDSVATNG